MKIAFCIREDYKTRGGGDVTQMLKTKEYLENNYDITIDIINTFGKLDCSFDLCHIFNYSTTDITKKYFKEAKDLGIKIASSPIYWDYTVLSYSLFSKIGCHKLTKRILYLEIKFVSFINFVLKFNFLTSKAFKSQIKSFVFDSDVILPNSEEEMDLMCKFINAKKKDINYKIVYNAAETNEVVNKKDFIFKNYNIPDNFILQVGRIEPIKNQIQVVKSLEERKDIPILFIGAVSHKEYNIELRKLAQKRGNVFFINEIEHQFIYYFYRLAKLHILPSLRESPGLVSLEAMSMGCEVIVSKFPYSPYQTYFKEYASAIDPLDIDSIKKKIIEVYDNKPLSTKKYNNEFTWEVAAKQTFEAYLNILSKSF